MEEVLGNFTVPASQLKLVKYIVMGVLDDYTTEEMAMRILVFSQEAQKYVKVSSDVLFARYTQEAQDQEALATGKAKWNERELIFSTLFKLKIETLLSSLTGAITDLYENGFITIEKGTKESEMIISPTPKLVAAIVGTQKPPG